MKNNDSKFLTSSPLLLGDSTIPGVKMPEDLKKLLPKIYQAVHDFGCDFFPTVVEMLTYDEISEVAAYGGFPVRYPHWKWGMEYEELQKGYLLGMHRIYEMVSNTNPVYLYCLSSNTLVDNVTVVAHALGHADFFKNNIYFSKTNQSQNMVNQLANHGERIRRYMSRWGKERVTEFIDHVLRIETLIDFSKAWERKKIKNPIIKDEREYYYPDRLKIKKDHEYMNDYLNPEEWINDQKDKIEKKEILKYLEIFDNPTKDIMGFIRDYAPLKPWEADIVSMLYDESMYFAPQRLTKVANEGFACVAPDTLISTKNGILTAKEIVDKKIRSSVFDGENSRKISNWFVFNNRNIISIETNRGYKLSGSENHRIYNENCEWARLDNLEINSKINLSRTNTWTENLFEINYNPSRRLDSKSIKSILGNKYWKYNYYKIYDEKKVGKQIVELSNLYDKDCEKFGQTQVIRRKNIKIPKHVDCKLASFIGYMIGDGHISKKRRSLGLTTGNLSQSIEYQKLLKSNFELKSKRKWDDTSKNGRWRISCSSTNLQDFLEFLGLKTGICARVKEIPECILKSPKNIVASFLKSYFDCDGYAGKQGIILSTSSEKLGEQVQVVLLNFGILCSRQKVKSNDIKKTHVWQLRITGESAKIFLNEIGFNLEIKQKKLKEYIENHKFFKKEIWRDKIVKIEKDKNGTVYDITVDETHKYSAHGFINHNSYVDYNIMAKQGFSALGQEHESSGIIEYSHHKMGVLGGKYSTNPYKLGFTLLMDIEDRWNKGRFGSEWEQCEDIVKKENWDKKLNLGRDKVFEVRKFYNDLTLIMEFFTPEFCEKNQFFEWKKYPNGEYKIENRDFNKIKKKLMKRHLNGGLPEIYLTDINHKDTGTLFLEHKHDGRPLYDPYIRPVLESLRYLWKNDICLSTKGSDGSDLIYTCKTSDGIIDLMTGDQYIKEN